VWIRLATTVRQARTAQQGRRRGKVDVAARTAIGLDIGTSGVRAAELSFGKSGITLEKFGQVALPEGSVRDGEVINQDAVADAVKQLWAHTKFSGKKVVIGVSNGKVIVRQVDLPWLPHDELKKALAFQVQDYIPIPVDHAVLDFLPLEEYESEHGARMLRGLLVAAARDMVMSSVAAVQAAGLTPTVVDLTSFAVLRALGAQPHLAEGAGQVEAVVDVGATVTNIVVHEGGIPRFVRILLMGGSDITEAVAERMGVPTEQAETVKQQVGLAGLESESPEDQAVARVMDSSGQAFVDEVRGSLDYYMASTGSAPITRIVISGGGGRLAGLTERLAAATRLPVVPASPISGLAVGKTGLTPEQISYLEPLAAVPVGLAMGASA
jgi:type IV pilus assembly protein PilM